MVKFPNRIILRNKIKANCIPTIDSTLASIVGKVGHQDRIWCPSGP
jgi:hypothetical protein